jgi:N-ethylmaleimide reductase
MNHLFDPLQIGAIALANRIVMAPLTRNRAIGAIPNPLMAQYYGQRASAGLIVTEASQISAQGQGYLDTPGIYSAEQVAAWRVITDAVHERGGRIVIQLWHVGRVSHVSLQAGGAAPVSSTARAAEGAKTYTAQGFVPTSTPRALRTDEIAGIVADYRHAANCAMQAGFDGVEVHAANGYLIDQFLRDSINDRSDAYGGAVANRVRLLVEVMTAVADEIGADRTGLRLSPITPVNGAGQDSDPQALFGHALRELAPLGLAFVHIIEGQTGGARDLSAQGVAPFDYAALRREFAGAWIVNNGYSRDMAMTAVDNGDADAVAFGKPFIANPDLVLRLRHGAALNPLDTTRLYGGGPAGYVDYPTLDAVG